MRSWLSQLLCLTISLPFLVQSNEVLTPQSENESVTSIIIGKNGGTGPSLEQDQEGEGAGVYPSAPMYPSAGSSMTPPGMVRFDLVPASYHKDGQPVDIFYNGTPQEVYVNLRMLDDNLLALNLHVVNAIRCEVGFAEADGWVTKTGPAVSTSLTGSPALMQTERTLSRLVCHPRQLAFGESGDLIFITRFERVAFSQSSPAWHPDGEHGSSSSSSTLSGDYTVVEGTMNNFPISGLNAFPLSMQISTTPSATGTTYTINYKIVNRSTVRVNVDSRSGTVTNVSPGVSTMMMGEPRLMDLEREIGDILSSLQRVIILDNGRVDFLGTKGTLKLKKSDDSTTTVPTPTYSSDGKYTLTTARLNGRTLYATTRTPVVFEVSSESSTVGRVMSFYYKIVNNVRVSVELDERSGVVRGVTPGASTMMAGDEEMMQLENDVSRIFESAERVLMTGAPSRTIEIIGRNDSKLLLTSILRRLSDTGEAPSGPAASSLELSEQMLQKAAEMGVDLSDESAVAQFAAQFGVTRTQTIVTQLVHSQVRDYVPTYLPTVEMKMQRTMVPTLVPTLIPQMKNVAYTTFVPHVYRQMVSTMYPAMAQGTTVEYVQKMMPQMVSTMVPSSYERMVPSLETHMVDRLVQKRVDSMVQTMVPEMVEQWRPKSVQEMVWRQVTEMVPRMVPGTATEWVDEMVPQSIDTMIATMVPTLVPGVVTTMVPTMVPKLVSTMIPTLVPRMIHGTKIVMRPTRVSHAYSTMVPTMIAEYRNVQVPTVITRMVKEMVQTEVPKLVHQVNYVNVHTQVPETVQTMVARTFTTYVPGTAIAIRPTIVQEIRATQYPTLIPGVTERVVHTLVPETRTTVISTMVPTMVQKFVQQNVLTAVNTYYSTKVPTMIDALVPQKIVTVAKHCQSQKIRTDIDLMHVTFRRQHVDIFAMVGEQRYEILGTYQNNCNGLVTLEFFGRFYQIVFEIEVEESGMVRNVRHRHRDPHATVIPHHHQAEEIIVEIIMHAEFMQLTNGRLIVYTHAGESKVMIRFTQ